MQARGGGGETPDGAHQGDRGSKLPPLPGVHTQWTAGAVEQVGWMVGANHGGGYLYSVRRGRCTSRRQLVVASTTHCRGLQVCPKSEALTEECLQQHPLSFVGNNHTVKYLDGRPDLRIPARDVSEGTFPPNSTWRINPIPACNCDQGFDCGGVNSTGNDGAQRSYRADPPPVPTGFPCPTGTQFPVPFDYGYGQQIWDLVPPRAGSAADVWVITDQVRAPSSPGEYVLRWRWDVEQNPQIWTHCADITVAAP